MMMVSVRILPVVLALTVTPQPVFAWDGAKETEDLRSLVSRMVNNELQSQKNPRYWIYLDSKKESGRTEVDRIVQLPQCWMRWPVSINGRPPSQDDRARARRQVQKLVQDEDARRKNREDIDADAHKGNELLKILPEAFLYSRAGRVSNTIRLKFRPDPKYNPSSSEAKVLHKMQGLLLIDASEFRLQRLSGRLSSDVEFGFGILGRIYKGGTFEVIQRETAPHDWEVTRLDVHISGKAVFFHTISEQQHEIKTQFKPVPAGITLAQAAALVEKGGNESSR